MATTFQALWGASNQAVTVTLASLADGAYRCALAIDNSTTKYTDFRFQMKTKTGTISGTAQVQVFLAMTANGGTSYSDGAPGTDATFTPTSPPNMRLIYTFNTPVSATAYTSDVWTLSDAGIFVPPDKFSLVFLNSTGAALDATGANHGVWFEGYNLQGN